MLPSPFLLNITCFDHLHIFCEPVSEELGGNDSNNKSNAQDQSLQTKGNVGPAGTNPGHLKINDAKTTRRTATCQHPQLE